MNRKERRAESKKKSNKWIVISLGTIIGLSHIGMIGIIARNKQLPVVNLPVGPYTAYTVKASKDEYLINYRANSPLVMEATRNIKRPGGFLGLGTKTIQTRELYTTEGLATWMVTDWESPLATRKSPVSKQKVVEKEQAEWSAVQSVPLLLLLVSPLFLMWVGCSLVLLRCLVWNKEQP